MKDMFKLHFCRACVERRELKHYHLNFVNELDYKKIPQKIDKVPIEDILEK